MRHLIKFAFVAGAALAVSGCGGGTARPVAHMPATLLSTLGVEGGGGASAPLARFSRAG